MPAEVTPRLEIGDERVVEIGAVAHGGHFIAHADGRTLLVRHGLPGETARVRITDVSRKIVRADAVEILAASADRVAPPCRWSGPLACGGCDFQHIDLGAQRLLKGQVLTDALRRFGRLSDEEVRALDTTVHALPGHADGLRWRTRMRWATGPDGALGLRRHRSHDVVPVDDCLIASPDVARPGSDRPGRAVHELRGRTWRQGADEFWQVHADLPEALVEAVLDLGAPAPEEAWWDLYSGAGLFAAFLGEAVGPEGRVEAVESSAPAVRSARRALHDQPQVRLHLGDVASWVRGRKDSPAGVVLDPPRAGAGPGIVEAIAATAAARILYVACDPVALGRDTARLAACGYRLTALRAFDAFPMTHHFEVVALVRRSIS